MKKLVGAFGLLFWMVFFCACYNEGDVESPGQIDDLTFFSDPAAVKYDGKSIQLEKERFPSKTYCLAWTAPGDNGDEGKSAMYDLRYISDAQAQKYGLGENPCDRESEFLQKVYNEHYPKKSGAFELISLTELGLKRSATYHFCLWALDEVGHASSPAHLKVKLPFLGITLTTKTSKVSGLGEKVFDIGDFDGRGFNDVSVSSLTQGKVLIYLGRKESELFWTGEIFGRRFKKIRDLYPSIQISGDPAENFGFAVSKLGDLNKKRGNKNEHYIQDIAISAPDAPAGKVYIYRYQYKHSHHKSKLLAEIEGESLGDKLGFDIAECTNKNNDLNLDSYPDFVVSAPGSGKVYVILGGEGGSKPSPLGPITSGNISTIASVVIQGNPADNFGADIDCGSDLNGDNIPDILISSDQENGATGAVYLFLGGSAGAIDFSSISARVPPIQIDLTAGDQSDLKISGAIAGERFGASLVMLGDIWTSALKDPSEDFAISAPGIGTGRIYVFFGGGKGNLNLRQMVFPANANSSQADLILEGITGELIGEKIAGKGDLNQDGHFDLATSNGNGEVRVYYLLPVHNPARIKSHLFNADSQITSFQLTHGFNHGLIIGTSGRDRAYILQ